MAKKTTNDGAPDDQPSEAPEAEDNGKQPAPDPVPEEAVNEQPIEINAQYTRDLSFEAQIGRAHV